MTYNYDNDAPTNQYPTHKVPDCGAQIQSRQAVRCGYGTTKAEALRAWQAGFPALLPDSNRWKSLVEDHRYGQHRTEGPEAPGTNDRCPACTYILVKAESGLTLGGVR